MPKNRQRIEKEQSSDHSSRRDEFGRSIEMISLARISARDFHDFFAFFC